MLTCEGDDENDDQVNEQKLEVPQIAENLNLERRYEVSVLKQRHILVPTLVALSVR